METPLNDINWTTLERRIHTQKQLQSLSGVRQILGKIQNILEDMTSPEKIALVQKFAQTHSFIESFYTSYDFSDHTLWRFKVALYKSHTTGLYFLRVESQFVGKDGLSVYKTMNYSFENRMKYDNLHRDIDQFGWIEKEVDIEHAKACIITELNHFADHTSLAKVMADYR